MCFTEAISLGFWDRAGTSGRLDPVVRFCHSAVTHLWLASSISKSQGKHLVKLWMNICMEMSSEICEDMTRCTERKTRNHLYIRFWKHLGREDACHIPWPSLLCGEDKRHGDLPKAACLEDVLRSHQRSTECAWIKAYSKIFRYLAVRPCIQVAAQKQMQKKCLSLRKMSSCSILSILVKDCTWYLLLSLQSFNHPPFPSISWGGGNWLNELKLWRQVPKTSLKEAGERKEKTGYKDRNRLWYT